MTETKTPRVRPGWIEYELGHWLRASTIVAVEAENLPEPESPDGDWGITALTAAGREWHSVYTTGAVLDAIAAAEPPRGATVTVPEGERGAASLAERAVADMESYGRENGEAVGLLGDAITRGASADECWRILERVQITEELWRHGAVDAAARVVGAYLMEHGHHDVWRTLFLVLLARFDLWTGWGEGYEPGDEVVFVREAGYRKEEAPFGYDAWGYVKEAG